MEIAAVINVDFVRINYPFPSYEIDAGSYVLCANSVLPGQWAAR
jgi:hypothetical protein